LPCKVINLRPPLWIVVANTRGPHWRSYRRPLPCCQKGMRERGEPPKQSSFPEVCRPAPPGLLPFLQRQAQEGARG
jgi:hypothetical protein